MNVGIDAAPVATPTNVEKSSQQLANLFNASTELMQVMARACGHNHLNQFTKDDLATWKRDMAYLSGVNYAGYSIDHS